jgi:hypothetical protein
MTRTTEPTSPDDPVLSLIARRKAEALAKAEKEHKQLEAAAKLFAQGSKIVDDAEENLRKGREKQDAAIASMLDAGLDGAQVAETLGLTTKAVTEAAKRHRSANAPAGEAPAKAAPAKRGPGRPKAAEAEAEAAPAPKTVTPVPKGDALKPAPGAPAATVEAKTADPAPATA